MGKGRKDGEEGQSGKDREGRTEREGQREKDREGRVKGEEKGPARNSCSIKSCINHCTHTNSQEERNQNYNNLRHCATLGDN